MRRKRKPLGLTPEDHLDRIPALIQRADSFIAVGQTALAEKRCDIAIVKLASAAAAHGRASAHQFSMGRSEVYGRDLLALDERLHQLQRKLETKCRFTPTR